MEESISNNRIKSSPSILSEISVQSSVSHFTLCPKLPRCTHRKASHRTDQYLNFASHRPLNHKIDVVRTLLDRMDRIVTEEDDKQTEEATIKNALASAATL